MSCHRSLFQFCKVHRPVAATSRNRREHTVLFAHVVLPPSIAQLSVESCQQQFGTREPVQQAEEQSRIWHSFQLSTYVVPHQQGSFACFARGC